MREDPNWRGDDWIPGEVKTGVSIVVGFLVAWLAVCTFLGLTIAAVWGVVKMIMGA